MTAIFASPDAGVEPKRNVGEASRRHGYRLRLLLCQAVKCAEAYDEVAGVDTDDWPPLTDLAGAKDWLERIGRQVLSSAITHQQV